MPPGESGAVAVESEGVRGFLHTPAGGAEQGLVITHGAGSNSASPLLVAVAGAFAAAGLAVLRCDLPYRQQRRTGPPIPGKSAADRAGLRAAVEFLRRSVRGAIFLGGHSYGGRQASMLAAEDAGVAEALLLLSYPLHPPRKPDELRTQHFPKLKNRCVFVHGTADPFGSIAEMERALALIAAPWRLLTIEGAGHDLARGRFDTRAMVSALLERRR